jgi:hypothetical protein
MSSKYDGKKLYRHTSAPQPEYEIRGDRIYRHTTASQAEYQIVHKRIYDLMSAGQPVLEIRGRYVYEFGRGGPSRSSRSGNAAWVPRLVSVYSDHQGRS